MRSVFRRRYVGLSLALCLVSATALAQSVEIEIVDCPPVDGRITIDGQLDEWSQGAAIRLGEANLVLRDEQYLGRSDLSGEFHVARDATTLYVAGRILDDTLFWNERIPWRGDGVEVFLDFHPDPSSRGPSDEFDEFVSQIVLHPLARAVRWSFPKYRGDPGEMDDPVDGIRLGGLPLRDARGAVIGYTFELALPFSNFTDEELAEGREIGFSVALSDSDGLPEQKNYCTWSGESNLAQFPARFGRLRMGEAPPTPSAASAQALSPTGPLAVLCAILGALLFLWVGRLTAPGGRRLANGLDRIRAIRLRTKVVLTVVVIVLVVGAEFGGSVARSELDKSEVEAHRETLARLLETAAEARRLGLLDAPDGAPLADLLSGRSIRAPIRYEYAVVAPVIEVPHRTVDGTPFLRRDLPALTARTGAYIVHPPVTARRVTFVYSWQNPTGGTAPDEGTNVAEVRLVHEDGRVAPAVPIIFGRNVAAFRDVNAGVAEARPAFMGTVPGSDAKGQAYELTVDVPLEEDGAPVVRVELEARAVAGTFLLHGVTLHGEAGSPSLPLALGRLTESGLPVGTSEFPSTAAIAELSAENEWIVISDLDVRADRLWLVTALRRSFADGRLNAPVALVEAVLDDGSVEGPFPLENGISIHAETEPAHQHGETFQATVAFDWGLPAETRRHFDVAAIPFERAGRRLRQLQFRFTGTDEVVRIAGITAGAKAAVAPLATAVRLEKGADGYRLPKPDREALTGLAFTLFRDGAAVATTIPGSARERSLARRLSPAQVEAVQALTTEESSGETSSIEEQRIVDGERLHALLMPLTGGPHGDVLEMVWRSGAHGSIGRIVAITRLILAALLVPLLVLVTADLVLRIPSLHVRLVSAFAAASAVPIVLAAFAVPQLVKAKIEGIEEDAVLEKASAVRRHLAALRPQARQQAEIALQDEALQEALRRPSSEDFATSVAAALRDVERRIIATAGGDARVALEVSLPDPGAKSLVIPEQARETVFRSPLVQVSDAFARRWSRVYASGVAKNFELGDSTKLVVELPLERAALEDAARAAGGGVQVIAYAPASGFPLAATLDAKGEEMSAARARRRAILRRVNMGSETTIESESINGTQYTVAYDVLREGAEPICLLAIALPRERTEALVERVETVSLLIFGAGVVMQFLLVGLVVGGATRRFQHSLARARLSAPEAAEEAPGDDLSALDAVLRELRRDREVYRNELAHLHEAVEELSLARAPDDVIEKALGIVRRSIASWGAVVIGAIEGDQIHVLGGYRGADSVASHPLKLRHESPLWPVIRGDEEWRGSDDALHAVDADLAGAAGRIEAFPLGAPGGPRGALILLHEELTPARTYHAEFAAALARHAGQALQRSRLVRLAVHDQDTGAYVGSYFDQRLGEEVDRAVAARRPIALILLRTEGVPSGPDAISVRRRLALAVRERAPARAFLGLYEHGVLAVAVPETDRDGADAFVRDLRRTLAERARMGGRLVAGLAACPEDAGSFEFLLAEAQRALSGADALPAPDGSETEARQQRLIEDARAFGAVFRSEKGVRLLETIERIAASDLTILVEGETGVGKEVVADLIHQKSRRGAQPLVKVNLAALPDTLLESELFGYERGAFTGADRRKPGRFELADGGTLFLDEIGELPASTQVKLLRVLEDNVVELLGGTAPVAIDVRVIAATNRDLRSEIAAGRFREDLFYRLNAVGIAVPPLRARKDDIPVLAREFVRRAAETAGRPTPEISPDAMDLLYRHPWPGNVRELRNALEQSVVLSSPSSDTLRGADLRPALQASTARWTARPGPRRHTGGATSAGRAQGLSDRQRRVLSVLSEQEWVTNTEYCDLVGISTRTGLRDLKDLIQRGLIDMDGKRRGARYRMRQ